VLAASGTRAAAGADLALVVSHGATGPATWSADVLLPDLIAAWRLFQAVPVAKGVSCRAVELSAGGSVLGALFMLPGVRGRGPGPVVAAAAAGLLTGRTAAIRVLRMDPPKAAPVGAWHALTAEQAQERPAAVTTQR